MEPTYTYTETRAKLNNIAPSSLKALVDKGKIRKVVPPGKTNGRYIKQDVDKYLEELTRFEEAYALAETTDKYEFTQAHGDHDIKESVHIARQNLGENAYGVDKRMEWFKLSPKGEYILKHENMVVAYFSMQAIKPEAIEDIFHKKSGKSLTTENMIPIEPEIPLNIHISGIGIKKGISKTQSRIYGAILLFKLFETFIKMGEEGIDIKKVWAKSSTVPGIKLCRDIGFSELGYVNNEQIGFVLDLETSNIEIAQKYRKALDDKKSHA